MKPISSFIQSLFVIIIFISSSYARVDTIVNTDMTLVHSGKNIVLHDDNTWEIENDKNAEIEKDVTVYLNDNRIVLIKTDYSWCFADKTLLAKREELAIKNVSSKGTAQHAVLSEASAIAMKNAVEKATKKLKASIKRKKLDFNKLKDCVRRVEKDVDSEETFTKGKGWSVVVNLTLDKGSVLAVLDCASGPDPEKKGKSENTGESKKETAKNSSPKKESAKEPAQQ